MTDALTPSSLAELSSAALTRRIGDLFRQERDCLVDFLWHLGEMDRRKGFLEMGHPSTFDWCSKALKMPNSSVWLRLTSARLLLRFPAIESFLRDGRLCMTTLVVLREVLEAGNHRDLLEQAADRTEDEVKVLVATLRPRPEVQESIRRLPARVEAKLEPTSLFSSIPSGSLNPSPAPGPDAAITTASGLARTVDTPPAPRLVEPPRPRIEPIDATRHSIKFTAGPEFMDLLKEARSALSHLVPDGNLETLLRVCMQKAIEDCARRQRGEVKPPRQAVEARMKTNRKKLSRYVPVAVRRAVWKRDGGRCTFVGTDGKRCGSTYRLQLDHLKPHAWGGKATVENLALRCAAHNLLCADKHFGEEHMAKFKRRRRRLDASDTASSPSDEQARCALRTGVDAPPPASAQAAQRPRT